MLVAAALLGACACSPDRTSASDVNDGRARPVTDASRGKEAGSAPVKDASEEGTRGEARVTPAPEGEPFATLTEWHLFADPVAQLPAARVVPYEVIAQLFADYATKYRFIYVPEGRTIGYSPTEKWDLPIGTILVKTFSYLLDARDPGKGQRLLETRLLIHESGGWSPRTYVWNAEQTEANRVVGGAVIQAHFIDPSGATLEHEYLVPSENDCRTCHGRLGRTDTLGGRTRQLDRDHDYGAGPENQIDHLYRIGFLPTPPPAAPRVHLVDPFGGESVSLRARAYMDANCSHCHLPGDAPASSTGFWLDFDSTDPSEPASQWGFCKQPTAAGGATCGHQFDVVPRRPDDSILTCRLESTLAKVRMPPVGRTLIHREGVDLIREWIAAMPGNCHAPDPKDAGTDASDAGTDASHATDASRETDAGPRDGH
jgi:uncharacterized repeat protein (TIGR03806 family)